MSDQELADKVVALGVGNLIAVGNYQIGETTGLYADQFVRDWRVAGICLEQWPTTINTEHLDMGLDEMLRNPRAIIEACVVALDGD